MAIVNSESGAIIETNASFKQQFYDDTQVLKSISKRNGTTFNQISFESHVFDVNQFPINDTLTLVELSKIASDESTKSLSSKNKLDDMTKNYDIVSFNALAKMLPIGIVQTDASFKIQYHNQRAEDFFGLNLDPKMSFIDLIYVEGVSEFWSSIEEMKASEKEKKFQFSIYNQNIEKEIYINCSGRAVRLDQNGEIGFLFVLEDITDNKEFTDEITAKNLELNQMNHELDKFLYSVSHNIRGPVASMEGLLKVIEISSVEAVHELKHHLRLNLRLLHSFVNDITNVAINIHTNIKYEDVRLYDLFEELIIFKETIHEVKCDAVLDLEMDYTLKTDTNRLTIILKNILKNSFQYRDSSKENLSIKIKAKEEVGFHVITIEDNGLGIDEQAVPRIFDMFYRGNENSTGNGMGLYNVREVLKKLGGRINVESEIRAGTEVKIFLPVKPLKK